MQRDRDGSFEPVLIPKHERRFTAFDDKIVAKYASGMTVREVHGLVGRAVRRGGAQSERRGKFAVTR